MAVGAVLGVLLAAAALTGHATRFVTVSDSTGSAGTAAATPSATHGRSAEHRPAATAHGPATEADSAEAPDTEGGAGSGGVHGSCVAAVARDHTARGGPHHNHGGAVSHAAHTCPGPAPSS